MRCSTGLHFRCRIQYILKIPRYCFCGPNTNADSTFPIQYLGLKTKNGIYLQIQHVEQLLHNTWGLVQIIFIKPGKLIHSDKNLTDTKAQLKRAKGNTRVMYLRSALKHNMKVLITSFENRLVPILAYTKCSSPKVQVGFISNDKSLS